MAESSNERVSAHTAGEWLSVGVTDQLVPLADYERLQRELALESAMPNRTRREAADALEAQAREIERLQRESDMRFKRMGFEAQRHAEKCVALADMTSERDRLQRELNLEYRLAAERGALRDRLRAALERINAEFVACYHSAPEPRCIKCIAREAFGPAEGTTEKPRQKTFSEMPLLELQMLQAQINMAIYHRVLGDPRLCVELPVEATAPKCEALGPAQETSK